MINFLLYIIYIMDFINLLTQIKDFFTVNYNSIALFGSFLFIILMFSGILSTNVFHLISFFYLFNKTISLLNQTTMDPIETQRILKWWASYSFFMIIEYLGNIILYYSPFYSLYTLFKYIFLFWVINEEHIESFYTLVVEPVYNVNQTSFETLLTNGETIFKDGFDLFNSNFSIFKTYFFTELAKYLNN